MCFRESKVCLELLEAQDHEVCPVHQERTGSSVQKDSQVRWERGAMWDLPDNLDHRVLWESLETLVCQVQL